MGGMGVGFDYLTSARVGFSDELPENGLSECSVGSDSHQQRKYRDVHINTLRS